MQCTRVTLPDGTAATVCGPRRRAKLCRCGSGEPAELLCDWKLPAGGTCDAPICATCTHVPAPDKDLCPKHAEEWQAMQAGKARAA